MAVKRPDGLKLGVAAAILICDFGVRAVLLEMPEEKSSATFRHLQYFLITMAIGFVLFGIYLLTFGTVFYAASCAAIISLLMFYLLTIMLTLSTNNILIGACVSLLIVVPLIIFFICYSDRILTATSSVCHGILYSMVGTIVALITLALFKWDETPGATMLALILFVSVSFTVGFVLGLFIFESNEKQKLERKWIWRQIIICGIGAYLFVKGVAMCMDNALYPNDAYLMSEKQHPIIENPVFFTLAFLITILMAVGFYFL